MIPTLALAQFGLGRSPGLPPPEPVSLLLHCNGSDGSTTITDSSTYAHTMTAGGDAQIDTAQSKYGGASLLFDGTSDSATTGDTTDLTMGADDFTLELFVRFATVASTRVLICKQASGEYAQYLLQQNAGTLEFYASSNNSSYDICGPISGGSLSIDTWYHVAVSREGSDFRLFLDGTQVATTSNASALHSTTCGLSLGIYPSGTSCLNGWMDEVRITKGTAWYTGSFTPPTGEHADP
jgi:hypothetical protein